MGCVILIAEDDVVIRNMARLLLQSEGHIVLAATDGIEALELSRRYNGAIDLLLTDLTMPRMDGLTLATQIRGDRPAISILIMAQNLTAGDPTRLPFLRKPFSPEVFRSKIREALPQPCAKSSAGAD